jgi:hypothetical protein
VYFPQFEARINELEVLADTYRVWLLQVGQLRLSGDFDAVKKKWECSGATYKPYLAKESELLAELREYAKKKLQ